MSLISSQRGAGAGDQQLAVVDERRAGVEVLDGVGGAGGDLEQAVDVEAAAVAAVDGGVLQLQGRAGAAVPWPLAVPSTWMVPPRWRIVERVVQQRQRWCRGDRSLPSLANLPASKFSMMLAVPCWSVTSSRPSIDAGCRGAPPSIVVCCSSSVEPLAGPLACRHLMVPPCGVSSACRSSAAGWCRCR